MKTLIEMIETLTGLMKTLVGLMKILIGFDEDIDCIYYSPGTHAHLP